MMFSFDDTIVAIASAADPAPRGVIRLSGENLATVLHAAFPEVRRHLWQREQRPHSLPIALPIGQGQEVEGRLLVWPGTRSYTRQPSAELHLLGAPVLLQLGVEAFCRAGARLAKPGEFTLRAFLAGRIDLTQAEAVLGLIDAESESAFQTALRQSAGGLAQPFACLREEIVDLLAELEATLDFIDQDIEFISRQDLVRKLQASARAAERLRGQIASRRELARPLTVVLAGAPNAGKSSLFNRIAGSDLAITSPEAGTTRDALGCRVASHGVVWELFDTAGMEQTAVKDPAGSPYSGIPVRSVSEAELELAAQSQTLSRIESADILLWCQPVSEVGAIRTAKWRPDVRQATQIIQVATKADQAEAGVLPAEWVGTSAKSGWGVDLLLARIADTAANAGWGAGEVMPVTAVRCAEQVQLMVEALDRAHLAAAEGWGEELVAAELRVALDNLGQIAGTVYNDEILGRIFSRFCIGK